MNDDTPEPEYLDPSDTMLPEAGPDHVIGNYRILQRVGEGGMGEVYEAEQEKPVRRRVALKVVKHGMDTRQVIARFESERQALAVMNHPNIARVFDAGATESGRPFFVMEFVKGEPITRYCDRYRLRTRVRLELFVQVCEGVQHAHQKGIIHRDIKPSNVLIQIEGDAPVPKIIDFGVAKATELRIGEEAAHTELGQVIGTPEYMSPEQAELTLQDIDTRSDVYSLGVLLYELLVGELPFDSQELRRIGFDEFRRKVREDEPPRPSTRVTALMGTAAGTAKMRGTDPGALAKRLRGDLDWITMKALEKDRTRRYGSPTDLAEDIQRHLRNEPVRARPPSSAYRVGKFARRHKFGVVTAAGLFLLLLVFAGVMSFQARRLAVQRDRANLEAAAASRVTKVMSEMFDLSDPSAARGMTISARELLDAGLASARRSLAEQPRELAIALGVIGQNFSRLALYEEAQPLLVEALERQRELLGEDHPATLAALNNLAGLYRAQGRYPEAEPLYEDVLARRRRVLGADDPDTLATMNALAGLYWNQGRNEAAEKLFVETLDARRRVLGNDHADTAESLNDLGLLYRDQGRNDRVEKLLGEALEIQRRVLGPDHPEALLTMNNLGVFYADAGRHAEAERMYREVLDKQREILGPDHPDTLTTTNNLASHYIARSRYEEAEGLYADLVERFRRVLGEEHPNTLAAMGNLGDLEIRLGRLSEAHEILIAAVEGSRRSLPPNHLVMGVNLRKYGTCLTHLARHGEAEAALLEAQQILLASLGPEHPQTGKAISGLVDLYVGWGQPDKADEWRRALHAPTK